MTTKILRSLRWFLPTCLLLICLAGGMIYLTLLADLPVVHQIELYQSRPTSHILDRNGRLLYELIDQDEGKQINLQIDAIPQACIDATLSTEDSRFYQHIGIDLRAITRAALQNARAGGQIVSGGSTLTQQLARILLLDADERYERTLRRKIREAWLAWRLEQSYTKDQLLALYLNQTYYGNFAFGLEAAGKIFFAKPASQLSDAECALLAGLIQYPGGYNPLQNPEVAKDRQLTVLRLMTESGYLTRDAAQQIANEPLQYKSQLFDIRAPHFVMYIQELLLDQLGTDRLRQGGLRVTTTLDLTLQEQAERAIQRRLEQLNCRTPGACNQNANPNRRVDNAAAIILDSQPTSDILAMVGGPDYFDQRIQGNLNASLSLRQPGSAIKPFTYAAALDPEWSQKRGQQPFTAATIIADLPTTFMVKNRLGETEAYTPLNYDRSVHGPVSLRTALASSYNIPAVKTLEHIGVNSLQSLATQAGISTFGGDFGLALTLGGGEVRLLELTAAFGIFQDGVRREPRAILAIEEQQPHLNPPLLGEEAVTGSPSLLASQSEPPPRESPFPWGRLGWGKTSTNETTMPIQENSARPLAQSRPNTIPAGSVQPIIRPSTAQLVTHILADDLARSAAFGSQSILDLPFDAAVKTGTTTDWRDNWTVGYSTERIIGVWVGNADNRPMLDISGIDGAGPIWHDLMLAAHRTDPPDFAYADHLQQRSICAPSGLLPTPACPRLRNEQFIAGTEPTQPDTQFQTIAIDRTTGQRADDQTPAARQRERVFWILPPEYHSWMKSQSIALAPPQLVSNDLSPTIGGAVSELDAIGYDNAGTTDVSSVSVSDGRDVRGPIGDPVGESDGQPQNQPDAHQMAPPQLVLSAPLADSTYQIHPGMPAESQRIFVEGYATANGLWDHLSLRQNGAPFASAQNVTNISGWWTLEPGTHEIWIEGTRIDGETVRSDVVTITVEEFKIAQR